MSFRQLLTMLAVFNCVFITTVSVSFSLPQLSTYWKVASLKHMKSVIISNWHKTNSFFKPRSGSIQGSFLGCFLSYRSPSLDLLGKTSTLAITIELELIFLLHTLKIECRKCQTKGPLCQSLSKGSSPLCTLDVGE